MSTGKGKRPYFRSLVNPWKIWISICLVQPRFELIALVLEGEWYYNFMPSLTRLKDDERIWDSTMSTVHCKHCKLSDVWLSYLLSSTDSTIATCCSETHWWNPQYKLSLQHTDDEDDKVCTVIVELLQKDGRALRHKLTNYTDIGFVVYKVRCHLCRPTISNVFAIGQIYIIFLIWFYMWFDFINALKNIL